jgi:hypothetical protein
LDLLNIGRFLAFQGVQEEHHLVGKSVGDPTILAADRFGSQKNGVGDLVFIEGNDLTVAFFRELEYIFLGDLFGYPDSYGILFFDLRSFFNLDNSRVKLSIFENFRYTEAKRT